MTESIWFGLPAISMVRDDQPLVETRGGFSIKNHRGKIRIHVQENFARIPGSFTPKALRYQKEYREAKARNADTTAFDSRQEAYVMEEVSTVPFAQRLKRGEILKTLKVKSSHISHEL